MPNECKAELGIILPTKNIGKLRNMFGLPPRKEADISFQKFRIWKMDSRNFKVLDHDDKGLSAVVVRFSCSWSVYDALVRVVDLDDALRRELAYESLDDAIKELGIKRIVGRSEEWMVGFDEKITYDSEKDKGVSILCFDKPEIEDAECIMNYFGGCESDKERTAKKQEGEEELE